VSWLTDPQAFTKYPIRSTAFTCIACGVGMGLVVHFFGDAGVLVALVTGVITAFGILALIYARFWRGNRPSSGQPRRGVVRAAILGVVVIALGVALGSVATVVAGAGLVAFWSLLYAFSRTRQG
jgi:hypothetical protein